MAAALDDDTRIEGLSPREVAGVLDCLGAGPGAPELTPAEIDRVIRQVLVTDAMGFAIQRGIRPAQPALRAALHAARLPYKARALQQNAALLARAARVSAALAAAGVEHLVLKGPLRQEQIYGDRFVRPSKDVDLLVRPREFAGAVAALERAGFETAHPEDIRFWWRTFAGQVHLVRRDDPGWSVDLHHRLQQPEVEQPAATARFFAAARPVPVGAQALPVPDPGHAALISAMNIVKALHKRDPRAATEWRRNTIVHACDLHADLGDADPARVRAFLEAAGDHGLAGTAYLALRVRQALFGVPVPAMAGWRRPPLAGIPDGDLVHLVLAPNLVRRWPKPHELIAALCAPRPRRMVQHLAWYATSSAVRRSMHTARRVRQRLRP